MTMINPELDEQIDAYLADESIEHPFCDQDATDEDGAPSSCAQCQRDVRGRQVTNCGLYPESVFCSISCLRNFVASDFE